jgi:dynein heavy chain
VLQCNYVRQAIDLLEGLIPRRDDNKDIPRDHLEKLIVFAIMWSLGALLEQVDRKKVYSNLNSVIF